MISDGDVLVVGEERLVRAEELADAGGVVDGGVEVGVVGDVDWFEKRGASDGVECCFGGLTAGWFGGCVKEGCEDFPKQCPSAWAEGHEWIQDWGLAGSGYASREKLGCGALVEVEQMSANGDTKVRLAFTLKGSVGEVGQREAICLIIGCGEPALVCGGSSLGHGGMIDRSPLVERLQKQRPTLA